MSVRWRMRPPYPLDGFCLQRCGFGHVRDNRSCQILSVNGACPSLVICAVPTLVKTTLLKSFWTIPCQVPFGVELDAHVASGKLVKCLIRDM